MNFIKQDYIHKIVICNKFQPIVESVPNTISECGVDIYSPTMVSALCFVITSIMLSLDQILHCLILWHQNYIDSQN